jgi:hypothetical protein
MPIASPARALEILVDDLMPIASPARAPEILVDDP